ncbi:hypothetical protein TNCV_1752851 [Trichonephila clavipes]|nr:hypothetical protein TNCV_1752851 [Trichonephila clavipes]
MYRWPVKVPFASTCRRVQPLIMMPAHHDTACRISVLSGYFLDDKQCHSHARSVGVYNLMTDWTYSHLRIVRMPSTVQSNCDAHDTIANGHFGASVNGHTQQVCMRIVLLPPQTSGKQFFEICFPEAATN